MSIKAELRFSNYGTKPFETSVRFSNNGVMNIETAVCFSINYSKSYETKVRFSNIGAKDVETAVRFTGNHNTSSVFICRSYLKQSLNCISALRAIDLPLFTTPFIVEMEMRVSGDERRIA